VLKPGFSIVIACLNSARTLADCLDSIRQKDFDQSQIEILVVDGGSTDNTRSIAQHYGATVLDNPRVDPVNAKIIGIARASHQYLMFLDSDEVLLSNLALRRRQIAFQEAEVPVVFATGYVTPTEASIAARYINEFGDPFSMYYYRLSKDAHFFIDSLSHQGAILSAKNENHIVFKTANESRLILETAACANTIDLQFFRDHNLLSSTWEFVHLFYRMQSISNEFAITQNDPVLHHSAETLGVFLRKIKWRIINNIFFTETIGQSGFSGRHKGSLDWRRYGFMPYSLFVFPASFDALYLAVTRRDLRYLIHPVLCLYTAAWIAIYLAIRPFGFVPQRKGYDMKKLAPPT